ncbi:MAG: Gx transporter family protein [Bacilli bacterium]|nr:Gx transporter family protein [Bacilli bacterium]
MLNYDNDLKKTVRLAMFLAFSVVLSMIETLIPLFNGIIPGFKIGLANMMVLAVLYIYGFKDAFTLGILKVILVGILRTGLFSTTFFFSLSGTILSVVLMALFRKITPLSIIGISIIGAISHSCGQIIIAILFFNINMIYYLPFILLFSLPSGILVGYFSKEIVNLYQKRLQY